MTSAALLTQAAQPTRAVVGMYQGLRKPASIGMG